MSSLKTQTINTLGDCLDFMASKFGGVIPTSTSPQYKLMVSSVQHTQDQDAYRGEWRRLLQKKTGTLVIGTDQAITLPDNFNKPTGIAFFFVGGVDWNERNNKVGKTLFVYKVVDYSDADYGKWKVNVGDITTADTYTLYYYAAPPVPEATVDKLMLPGDMIVYGALGEYLIRTDDTDSLGIMREEHENRFQEYLSLEMMPNRQDMPEFKTQMGPRYDRTARNRNMYSVRSNRNRA